MTSVTARTLSPVGRARRRPTGDPPPLPRPIYTSGRVYLALTAGLLAAWIAVVLVGDAARLVDRTDEAILTWFAGRRRGALTELADAVDVLASDWLWRVLRWTTLAVLVVNRRVRHLLVYVALLLVITGATNLVIDLAHRAPAGDLRAVSDGNLFSHPSRPVVELGLSFVGAMYTLLPRGRVRNRTKVVVAAVMAALVLDRLYLGADNPTDLAAALIIGMAVPVVLFRFLVPHSVFRVVYGRRDPARTLDDRELDAIRAPLRRLLAADLSGFELLRLRGSAGSTPMRLDLEGDSPAVFAKLYSLAHLRADRWYKLGRAILYGRLEDEAPFADIRHLVEHEDYLLRVATDAGVPVPRSCGVLELTPGREYLLVTELLPDARQVNDVELDAGLLAQGFAIVDALWSAGLAHRDIKPANLVVSGGRVYLVDLSFAELHATPWRLAVDLGNMLLTLALVAGPDAAYEAARTRFTDDEIAEALAATRSVTIPAQLRAMLRRSPGLVDRCRALAPAHPPFGIQRWTAARVMLTAGVVAATVAAVALLAYNLDTAGLL